MTYNELTKEQQSAVDAIKKITNENEDFLTDEQIAEIVKINLTQKFCLKMNTAMDR